LLLLGGEGPQRDLLEPILSDVVYTVAADSGFDLAERDLLRLLARHPRAKIVVTPLGGNGFVFGRGNKQFTPEVIRKVGCGNLIIVSIPSKLADLPCLRVDTGDSELDGELAGYVEVVVGFRRSRMMRLEC